jgi:DNA repair protein RecN (Recombination protein N)
MLVELNIRDFAIIERLRLTLGPGFNVFTGETGAGKSIIIDAISALVGERMGADIVRAGSERATIEGIFDVSAALTNASNAAQNGASNNGSANSANDGDGEENANASLAATLAELGIETEDGLLILGREMTAAGRGLARVNGRAAPLSILQRLSAALIDIHGQSAHLTLLKPERHLFYLDRYAGLDEDREKVAALYGQWRETQRELERLRADERAIERRIELLQFQVDEIAAANLKPGEDEALERERRMLANAERLGELTAATYAALRGGEDGDEGGALDQLGAARRALGDLLRLDDTLTPQAEILEQALFLLEDVGSAVRGYQDQVMADPARLAEVEERLDLLNRLRRKYGATIDEMTAFAEEAARELETLTNREERAAELATQEEQLRERIGSVAGALSARRTEAAHALAAAMDRELDDLNMRKARFEVQLAQRPDPNGVLLSADATARVGFSVTGIDQVEFLLAPNPGEPLKPLARIASGGETSRLMLAIKTILANADATPTLIFDEIDAGISGRSGQVVGEKLWGLGQTHQTICITHLPQIAALGDVHYQVSKEVSGGRTTTRVTKLDDDNRVAELSQMLGGASTSASRANAQDLLSRAREWKSDQAARVIRA